MAIPPLTNMILWGSEVDLAVNCNCHRTDWCDNKPRRSWRWQSAVSSQQLVVMNTGWRVGRWSWLGAWGHNVRGMWGGAKLRYLGTYTCAWYCKPVPVGLPVGTSTSYMISLANVDHNFTKVPASRLGKRKTRGTLAGWSNRYATEVGEQPGIPPKKGTGMALCPMTFISACTGVPDVRGKLVVDSQASQDLGIY